MHDVEYTGWRKPRRSNASGNCVEVGTAPGRRVVGVRDSKQGGRGPVLEFTVPVWQAFLADMRNEEG
jgi:hypothetical protein